MAIDKISVVNANVHNLTSVSCELPKDSLIVITGPSGSGKSSLAFDTLYVESQRRYIESLSSYARQFLGQQQPPDVESITGLSPSIAIDQKTSSRNPRSTVGTITEIYDYLRVLFARVGTLKDPETGEEVRSYTPNQIVTELFKEKSGTKVQILFKLPDEMSKSLFKAEQSKLLSMGFSRIYTGDEVFSLEDFEYGSLGDENYIVVDRVVLKSESKKRISDSVELVLKLGSGTAWFLIGNKKIKSYSEKNISSSGEHYPDLEPRLFSFNSPMGACSECNGLGESKNFDIDKIIFDENLPVLGGAIGPLTKRNKFLFKMVESILEHEGISSKTTFKELNKKIKKLLLDGGSKVYKYSFKSENSHFEFSKPFPGLSEWLYKKYRETTSEKVRSSLEEFMSIDICPECDGKRLNKYALNTFISGVNIIEIAELSLGEAGDFIKNIKLDKTKAVIAEKLLKEINNRVRFLNDVGLSYLNLNRSAGTLSGGESQRIRLATQIGSSLSGVLYILDEPSIGLHQRDNQKLIKTLKELKDLGNTVIVVEHDEETMMSCDYLLDMGPGAGIHGGKIVASGPLKSVLKSKESLTAKYLSKKLTIEVPKIRRESRETILLRKAKSNNLKEIDVEFPLNTLTCITGVSGSGKSTLVHSVLVPAVKNSLTKGSATSFKKQNYHSIKGLSDIKSVIQLDQSPIGRTPHSNPATYTSLFDSIRTLFSKTQESQVRGYKPGRFSFNVKGGRCEECEGNGVKKIEMHFLPDVYITCSDCNGSRYNPETLSVLYKGKNISDILSLSIEEAAEFFKNHTSIKRTLDVLNDVGLGYIKLGQPATTLSGGEAQRLKLSRELSKRPRGKCLYVLDEPTTGLHFQDIKILLKAINKLVDAGHTVIVIEHNLDVVKSADFVIDLGPEGGDAGGNLVAAGTPEEVAKSKKSITGKFLKECLK
ncbi:MAG: excinuclease ABC subunit A [Halobacteriovorax sp.]|nr:excinuclease ABC subunit A [Halobacteriovorax sp.]|tara:strand:- start:359814 stop:362624 length:2811 start_codon:yes stop_codon:yes gene_type:complete